MSSSSEGLSDLLERVLSQYPVNQIGDGITAHTTREDVQERIPGIINEVLNDDDIVIKSSVGQGRWTSIPWIAVMDPRETTAIQEGIYVVYLFEPQEGRVTLSLNQGVTTLKDELGTREARQQLKSNAKEIRSKIHPDGFSQGSLEFPNASQRNKLYGPGTIYYRQYKQGNIPSDEELKSDLQTLVDSYQTYISADDGAPTIYQAPIKPGGPIQANFERTVIGGIPRERLEDICDLPISHRDIRVWGNRESNPANVGDYLLFASRDGRHDGEYTILARIANAAVLDEKTAEEFTNAVGWDEQTDAIFPHVMFLEPLYEVDLDQDKFWELLGYKGFPNDTYSPIKFDRPDSTFFEEYSTVEEFIDQIKGKKIYPEKTVPEYGSMDDAIADIRRKISRSPDKANWLKSRLGEAIIRNWSAGLSGFKPSDEVTSSTAAKFDQLRSIFESLEGELEPKAQDLGVGTFEDFSPGKMLFLGWFRIIQEELDITGSSLSQPRLNSILNDTYTDESSSSSSISGSNSISNHLENGEASIYKFTAPPDYWLSAYEYAAIGFEESESDEWEAIQQGDVIFFHSTQSPGWEVLDDQEAGIIGAGIVQATTVKADGESWWYDEQEDRPKSDEFPYLVTFESLYATGDLDVVDFTKDIYAKTQETVNSEIDSLTSNLLSFSEVEDISREASGSGFPRQKVVRELNDRNKAIAIANALSPKLRETPAIALGKAFQGRLNAEELLNGLYFPGQQGEEIIAQIEGALRAGKHVILTGPPGTGKTEIARRLGEYLVTEYPYLYSGSQVTTATADWSTFDTVGGYMPNEKETDGNHLEFTPGLVLNRFKSRTNNSQRNESLVIDELNRADIDKAFGQLFTVLSGQSVQLPYTKDGREVELAPFDGRTFCEPHEYRVPDSWSLIATLNTYDKTSLYEMSYAFMRRFSFIRVPAPRLDGLDDAELRSLLLEYTDQEVWDIQSASFGVDGDAEPLRDVGHVWRASNSAIEDRAIGPAVVKDMLEYLSEAHSIPWERRLTQAVISYIFPQLEGVPKRDRVVRGISEVDHLDQNLLDEAARDILQVTIQDSDE
ncbi:MrcB family domain-containing protein [Halobellus ordinarius]|uniref:MrcB family domain-containing protein n=1 Tax=Halobellus ordinarius TaxID=3075120 RepID=UPI0028805B8F|nr:DUF3578 domain-containing protein [Halobellus sp. ZY16]